MSNQYICEFLSLSPSVQFNIRIFPNGTCIYIDNLEHAELLRASGLSGKDLVASMALDVVPTGALPEDYTFQTAINDISLLNKFAAFGKHRGKLAKESSPSLEGELTHYLLYLFWRDINPQLKRPHNFGA